MYSSKFNQKTQRGKNCYHSWVRAYSLPRQTATRKAKKHIPPSGHLGQDSQCSFQVLQFQSLGYIFLFDIGQKFDFSPLFLLLWLKINEKVILMQKWCTPIELLIGNTTVNVFVHHSSVPLQTVLKWEVLKHEDCLQPLLFEITVLGIGGTLASLGYYQTL